LELFRGDALQGLFDDENENVDRDSWPQDKAAVDEPVVMSSYTPPTSNETIRRNGLAYSAGIAFAVTIAFMLFLGWLADQIIGSSPWGIVGGILLGSIIGFLQFFRTTRQIFQPDKSLPAEHPLMAPSEQISESRDRSEYPSERL
jgi:F0F1-type ATP synthase assembly protein I